MRRGFAWPRERRCCARPSDAKSRSRIRPPQRRTEIPAARRRPGGIKAAELFRLIHHSRALCAERTGLPFRVEHCVVVRRGVHDARVADQGIAGSRRATESGRRGSGWWASASASGAATRRTRRTGSGSTTGAAIVAQDLVAQPFQTQSLRELQAMVSRRRTRIGLPPGDRLENEPPREVGRKEGGVGPANSSGSFTTIARPAQKGLAFRSASSIVSSSDAARMMRG